MSARPVVLGMMALVLAGCMGNTITPNYSSSNPNLQVGGKQPADPAPQIEHAGSFCLEVKEKWHKDGSTPDDQALWAKDTLRKVVPCK